MTTIHHLHLTRDRDGNVSVHDQVPSQDWLGYWATTTGTTESLSGNTFASALFAKYIEKLGYDKPIDVVVTIQEE